MRGGTVRKGLNLEKIRAHERPQGLSSAGEVCELMDKEFGRTTSNGLILFWGLYGED